MSAGPRSPLRRKSLAWGGAAVLGWILVLAAGSAAAEGAVGPAPPPTQAEETKPANEGAVVENPTPAADDSGESAASAEATPTPTPQEGEGADVEPAQQFDLNPYPEDAKLPAKQKWRTFTEGARGLLVWDFFDSRLTIRAHARLQIDGTLARADSSLEQVTGPLGESLKLRRFEGFAQGTIDHHLRYSVSFNLGADPGFGDLFVEGRDHGLNVFGYRIGNFRVGSFQEPFSFERMMSSYYTGFLERSLPVWTFTPGNNIGYMVYDTAHKKRLTWAVGFFTFGQNNEANSSKSALSVTSRVTWLPVYLDGGRKLLHLGASVSSRDPSGGHLQYRARPEARFVNYLVDTGEFNASRIGLYGIEIAGMSGPLSFQSEAIASQVSGTDHGDLAFWGGYVEVGWFLTGDHRSYDTGAGVFSKVIPTHPQEGLFRKKPGGALEFTGRVSNVDLDDGTLNGGRMLDLSFGVNWYLNATSAVKFNYIYTDVKDRGKANILVLRYQFRPIPVPGWK